MSLARKLLIASVVCWAANATAAPTLLFSAQRQGSTELVELVVRVKGFTSVGLTVVHLDLGYDTTMLSLESVTAGDFFALNAPDSAWTDTYATVLSSGDFVASGVTDDTTRPDVLGFDFLETLGRASKVEGELLRLVFRFTGSGVALFTTNDILMVDGIGNPTYPVPQTITVSDANAVPEPGVASLVAFGVLALSLCRRKA